jgi:hypothetical protein
LAKSNEHELCKQFVINHLTTMQLQFDQYTTDLITQTQTCPSTLLPMMEILDANLKEFVQLQQKYLVKKRNAQLVRYKDMIYEKEFFLQNLSSSSPSSATPLMMTIDQVNSLTF